MYGKSGFRVIERVGRDAACYTYRNQNLPACQPNAVIPSRSVLRRVNSAYCKEWKDKHLPVCEP